MGRTVCGAHNSASPPEPWVALCRTPVEHQGDGAVTGIKTTGEKKLMLFSGRAHPDLAEAVADELGVELVPTRAFDFANGEIYVRFEESARGADCFLIQSHT